MTKITLLPHKKLCKKGATFEANPGNNLMQCLIKEGIIIEHACEGAGTCSTCHVYVRKGLNQLNSIEDREDETLNRAWGLDIDSRLSCQVTIGEEDLTIEIPEYTCNQIAER